ncbi:MAG: sensor histidine kinase [Gemmatimonadaceae bacterium]|nr:sensor histidine kinase [Gemmatimonadaceae bacterium]
MAARWLDRIADRVSLDANEIFPSDELLDHVPLLIQGVADYLEDPVNEIGVDMPVVAKAMELGALRHAQGFDAYQILKEYEILGGILFAYLAEAADKIPEPCEKSELLYCGQRLFKAVTLIQQTTTMQFLRLADAKIAEREERLRAFNRSVSHEIKNQISAILGAGATMLEMPDLEPARKKQFIDIVIRNARTMRHTIENLIALSQTEWDSRQHRHIELREAAREAVRGIRESAEEAGLEIRIAELPEAEINAAAVELCLTNYLSNAIKYADPSKTGRFAEISGAVDTDPQGQRELVIRVRDNGLGVPPEMRDHLFERFFRAHDSTTDVEGTGLGLSIVAETAESLGGRAWAEFPGTESVFAFALPFRRKNTDSAAALETEVPPEPV